MTEPNVPPQGRVPPFLRVLAAVAGAVAIGVAVLIGLRGRDESPCTPPAEAGRLVPAPAERRRPGFDIVRVNPRGDAVIAGHAPPGSQVRIEDGGREIGRAQADQRGDFVFLPAGPLAPGARALTFVARMADGRETRSADQVLLDVPERDAAPAPVAVLSAPDAPPRVLQSAPGDSPALELDAAERDALGVLRLAGRAPPGAPVRVYLDDTPVGDARADAQGRWTLAPPEAAGPGNHRVRVDQFAADGRVLARALAPLPREEAQAPLVVVRSGQTLWRLARAAYGSGVRYTVLYEANRGQIADPDRIYPGQAFAVPALRAR